MESISERDTSTTEVTKVNTDCEFVAVANHDNYYKSVKKAFKDIVAKLYGDQTTAIKKIKESEDRKCLVLVEKSSPVAILVYKVEPSSEFSRYNIENSLEVKTFMLLNPDSNKDNKDSERHLSKLYNKVVDLAKQTRASGIHVTVSQRVTWTMGFLRKMGFRICHCWKDKYVQGLSEYMMYKKFEEASDAKISDKESERTTQHESEAKRGFDFKKHEKYFGSSRRPENQGQQDHAKKSAEQEITSSGKRKLEGDDEFDHKRPRVDESTVAKQQQSSYSSQQGSHQRREDRGETRYGRSYGERGFNFSPGNNMRQGDRGESRPNWGRNSSEPKVKQCTLMKKYIHMIQDGKKTVEGRINSGMFKGYRKGDMVRFFYQQNKDDDVTCKIEDVVPYKTFEEMLSAEGVNRCIPGIHKVSEGVRAYHQIPGYEQKERQHGVVAFRLKLVSSGTSGWRR